MIEISFRGVGAKWMLARKVNEKDKVSQTNERGDNFGKRKAESGFGYLCLRIHDVL
jgi:hypothetical protein